MENRTPDLVIANDALYQLSYDPVSSIQSASDRSGQLGDARSAPDQDQAAFRWSGGTDQAGVGSAKRGAREGCGSER